MLGFKRFFTCGLILLLSLLCVSCGGKEKDLDYSNHQYSEFINTILEAYSYSNQKSEIVELNDETAVFKVDNGKSRYILFDLKNQRVISSDYKMKNKNTIKLANFTNGVTDIQYDYSYDDNGNVSNIKSSMVDYKFVYNDKAKIIEKWQNGNLLESKEYDGNNLDSILYLNNYKIDYIYGGDNLIYEVYGNDELLYDLSYNTDLALETYYDVSSDRLYQYNYYNLEQFKNISVNDFNINYTYADDIIYTKYNYKGLDNCGYKVNGSLYSLDYEASVQNDIADRPRYVTIDCGDYKYNIEYEYIEKEPMVEELTEDNYEDYIYNITSDVKVDKIKNNIYEMEYRYNDFGLISYYSYGDMVYEYKYDDYGQLNSYKINGDIKYIDYDNSGNIIQYNNNEYRYTSVGNLNRMISLNGQNIEYDEIGNPTKYKNLDLIWNGRTLKSYGNAKFNYDKYGNRIQKHVGNNTTNYYYDNSNIIYECNDDYVIYYIYLNDSIIVNISLK